MLLRRLKLVNYGGIYNGLGLNEIEIDFTRCTHRIVLIKGDNGSGKSTIENALNPLPDDSMCFISGLDARKEIDYYDEMTGTIYSIVYIHSISGSTRKTTGYISKTINGIDTQLNPSGNITSCKEFVYEELQLDPNYITLTQLSSTKRGIADLKPADRKRYVNAILTTTDVYNDMYKTLTKKASGYKNMVKSISSKIESIGNIVQLQQNLNSIEERIREGEDILEHDNEIMNKEKGMLNSIDPDNKLRERIEYLDDTLKQYKDQYNNAFRELKKLTNKCTETELNSINPNLLYEMNNRKNEINNNASNIKGRISAITESRQTDADELQAKTAKLNSINSSGTLTEIKTLKANLTEKKEFIERRWNDVIILDALSADEFLSIYDIIVEMIDVVNSIHSFSYDVDVEYRECMATISSIDDSIDKAVNDNNIIVTCEEKVSILESRPANCTNDACPFISDALNAKALMEKMHKLRQNQKSISSLNSEKEKLQSVLEDLNKEKYLIQMYNANHRVLKSLKLNLDTYESCVNTLKNSSNRILMSLKEVLEYANDIDEYKVVTKSLTDITNKYHALSSQEDFIKMITDDIFNLQRQLDEDVNTITALNNELDQANTELINLEGRIELYSRILEYTNTVEGLKDSMYLIDQELQTNKDNIDKIQKINSDIEKLTDNINKVKSKLGPLRQDRETISYNLRLSSEYARELQEYKDKYEKIDTLKYYCSPTTGIQLLFANMYLSKILDNANRILQGLFGGIFALLPLIITETEFKIPVAVNGGLNHDDITSMSSAQISLISMIISISLLSQTSSKLNIIVGDEIDAPFDSENRREFISILYQLMSLVCASQCVLISHNSEIPLSECDIILLKSDNDVISEGNIIWSYK